MAVAFGGLGLIGLTTGGDLPVLAFGLAVAGAFSWAVGNVLVKRTGNVPMFPFMAWLSLVPLLPALLVSSVSDPNPSVASALIFGEQFGAIRSTGMVLILISLTIIVLPVAWFPCLRRARRPIGRST